MLLCHRSKLTSRLIAINSNALSTKGYGIDAFREDEKKFLISAGSGPSKATEGRFHFASLEANNSPYFLLFLN